MTLVRYPASGAGPAGPAGATGATGPSGVIASINGDSTAAQVIDAGFGIDVATSSGITTVTNLGTLVRTTEVNVTNTYTPLATDASVLTDFSSALTMEINLPTAVGLQGQIYVIARNNNDTSNESEIFPFGAETIDGQGNFKLFALGGVVIISDNANWLILGSRVGGVPP